MNSTKYIRTEIVGDSIFLNEKYDSAIMWVNYETSSVIYSLSILVQIDTEDMGNEGLLDYLPDGQDLFQFLTENFCHFFELLQKMEQGIPPKILFDIADKFRLAA